MRWLGRCLAILPTLTQQIGRQSTGDLPPMHPATKSIATPARHLAERILTSRKPTDLVTSSTKRVPKLPTSWYNCNRPQLFIPPDGLMGR